MGITNKCVLCGQLAEMTNEHVLPASIGGELTVTATCIRCNRQSSLAFEAEFLNSVKPFCHILGVGNRASNIPSVNVRVNVHGRDFAAVLSPALDLTVHDSVVERKNQEGKTEREYWMFSKKGRQRVQERAAKRRQHLVPIPGGEDPIRVNPSSSISLSFLTEAAAKRTIAKIALLYLARQGGLTLVNTPAYDLIRTFIMNGSGEAVRLFTNRDFIRATRLNAFQHFLMAASDAKTGRVAALVILFGGLSYVVNLASGATLDFGSTFVWDATERAPVKFLVRDILNEQVGINIVLDGRITFDDLVAVAERWSPLLESAARYRQRSLS